MSSGRVAIVTGGARGIGLAVASALAADGYHVVILDKGVELDGTGASGLPAEAAVAEIAARGGSVEAAACDVGDVEAVGKTIADVEARHGRIDVLANVAGILRPGPFLADTADTWTAVLSVHLGGHLAAIGAVLPGMLARREGRILNFTSTAALLGSRRQPAYSTAKQAVVGLTLVLAKLLAPAGIAMNAISPAAESRMSAGLRPAPDPSRDERSAELSDREPGHVGQFACWLAGPQAAGVTGRIFLVSGHYVIEYEHMRPWKWSSLPAGASQAQVAEHLRWVLGRPHPITIGPWPTRDFQLADIDRLWEGTAIGPDLAATAATDQSAATGEPAEASGFAVFGAADTASAARLLGKLTGVRPVADFTAGQDRPAAGAIVFGPGCAQHAGGPRATLSDVALPAPEETCATVASMLSWVQSGLALTKRHDDRAIAVVLPPWPGEQCDDLACALTWYAAVGLIRGSAATEGIYGVRVNGLTVEPGYEDLGGAVTQYLLSSAGGWLNGHVLTADSMGIGLLADERPRWQSYSAGGQLRLPPAVRQALGAEPAGPS